MELLRGIAFFFLKCRERNFKREDEDDDDDRSIRVRLTLTSRNSLIRFRSWSLNLESLSSSISRVIPSCLILIQPFVNPLAFSSAVMPRGVDLDETNLDNLSFGWAAFLINNQMNLGPNPNKRKYYAFSTPFPLFLNIRICIRHISI